MEIFRSSQKLETEKDSKKKKPGFWDRIFNKNKLKNQKKVAVLYLRENGNAEPMHLETKNGFFHIEGRTYHERRDCLYALGKDRTPLALIPEWSVLPIGRKQWEDRPMQEKFSTLQDHVMKGIRHAERVRMGDREGKQLNGKTIVVLLIIAVVVGAIFMGYK